MDGQDGGVVVHAGAEGVEQVADRDDRVRGGGGCEGAGEVEEGFVAVAVGGAGARGVGFSEAVGVQQKGVAGVQADGGGGDVSVGQDTDELAAGVGR